MAEFFGILFFVFMFTGLFPLAIISLIIAVIIGESRKNNEGEKENKAEESS